MQQEKLKEDIGAVFIENVERYLRQLQQAGEREKQRIVNPMRV